MFTKKRWLMVMALGGLLLLAVAFSPLGRGAAQVSPTTQTALTIPYSASLFDKQGNAIQAGFYDFTFAVFNKEAGGILLWSEIQPGVEVEDGNFTVLLGSVVALPQSIFTRPGLWLEVAVRPSGAGDFTLLAPRQPLIAPSPSEMINEPTQSNSLSCEHTHFGESWSGGGLAGLVINTPSGNLGGAFYGKTGGLGYGIFGQQQVSLSTAGGGVAGFSNSSSGYGGYFENTGGGKGILGKSNSNDGMRGESGSGVGVFGKSNSNDGVRGEAAGAVKSGVYGFNSANGYGVFGRSTTGFGLGADGKDDSYVDGVGDLWLGGVRGEIISQGSVDIFSNSSIYLDLDQDQTESNACLKIFNSSGIQVGQTCEDGTKSAILQTEDHGQRAVYVIESPEVWLQDFGTATLLNGQATVTFESIFAQTINSKLDYHIQLTPVCQEAVLLFIVSKGEGGFTVQGVGLDGTPSSCSFDYTVTAKRLALEEYRLEEVLSEK